MPSSQQDDIPPLRRQAPQDIRVPGVVRAREDRQSARGERRVEMQLCVDLGVGCFLSWSAVDHCNNRSSTWLLESRQGDVPLIFECAWENAKKKSATVEKLDTIPAYAHQPHANLSPNTGHTLTTAPAKPNLFTMIFTTAFFASLAACGASSGGPVDAMKPGREERRSFAAAWPVWEVLACCRRGGRATCLLLRLVSESRR